MATRKTKTPRWLSIFRKLYAYLGVTGLSTVLVGRYGITDKDMLFILEIYMYGLFAIQVVCDAYFFKDNSMEPYRVDPKDANR